MKFTLSIFVALFFLILKQPHAGSGLPPYPPLPMTDTSGFFSSFDSVRIYFEMKGQGRTVVLVHGFIVSGESWKKIPLYDDLIKAGFRVITLDLRGNGKSDKPHRPEDYANDAEARDIEGLVTALGFSGYDAVGYSRGSIITARLLLSDKRIYKAVIGGMGTGFTNPEWPRRIMFYKALMGEPVRELEAMIKHVREAGLDQLALTYMQKEQPSASKIELATVRQPVLVICGDQDADNSSSIELSRLFPQGSHVSVPGDHAAALSSKEFSEKVISFLSTQRR